MLKFNKILQKIFRIWLLWQMVVNGDKKLNKCGNYEVAGSKAIESVVDYNKVIQTW